MASSFASRLVGLAGKGKLEEGEGILIPHCSSVHTVGMRLAIDVVFIAWPPDATGKSTVLDVRGRVPPLRIVRRRGGRDALATIELGAGTAGKAGIVPGAVLTAEPSN